MAGKWKGYPHTKAGVEVLQSAFQSAGEDITTEGDTFNAVIDRLDALIKIVKEEEKAFAIGLGLNPKKPIQDFEKKIQRLREDKGFVGMINKGSLIQEYINAVRAPQLSAILSDTLSDSTILHRLFTKEDLALLKDSETEVGGDFLIQALNRYLQNNAGAKHSGSTKNRVRFIGSRKNTNIESGREIVSIQKRIANISLTQGVRGKPAKLNIEFDKETPLSTHYAKEILAVFNKNLDKDIDNSVRQDMIDSLYTTMRQHFTNPALLKKVKAEMDNTKDYDLNTSESSIKGFLGEINAKVTLDYLFGRKGKTIPTGVIRTLQEGQEIPIDIVVEKLINGTKHQFHFQIKNYKEITRKGRTVIEYAPSTMQAGNFINDRISPSAVLCELLLRFFGSFQVNQIKGDSEGKNLDSVAVSEYGPVYKNFTILANKYMPNIMMAYLDNIIKVSNEFQARGEDNPLGLFTQPDLYINTFFRYGKNFIPSSAILQGIKDTLDELKNNQSMQDTIFQTAFEIKESPKGKPNLYNSKGYSGSRDTTTMANMIKIKYSLSFDVNEILNRAWMHF